MYKKVLELLIKKINKIGNNSCIKGLKSKHVFQNLFVWMNLVNIDYIKMYFEAILTRYKKYNDPNRYRIAFIFYLRKIFLCIYQYSQYLEQVERNILN